MPALQTLDTSVRNPGTNNNSAASLPTTRPVVGLPNGEVPAIIKMEGQVWIKKNMEEIFKALFIACLIIICGADAFFRYFELRPNRKKYLMKYGPKLEEGKTPIFLWFFFGVFWAICLSSERKWRIHAWVFIVLDLLFIFVIAPFLLYVLTADPIPLFFH